VFIDRAVEKLYKGGALGKVERHDPFMRNRS
jgi:hypothetical protein